MKRAAKLIKIFIIFLFLFSSIAHPLLIKAQSIEGSVLGSSVFAFNNALYIDGTEIKDPKGTVDAKSDQPLFSGYTYEDVSVALTINSTEIQRKVTSDSKGFWEYQLDQKLESGKHTLRLNITDQSGKSTGQYLAATFMVSGTQNNPNASSNSIPAVSFKSINYLTITLFIFGLIILLIIIYLLLRKFKKKHTA